MRIFLFSDVHWSRTSSIVRSIGNVYSTRLEYLIKSLNWANQQAVLNNCNLMVCAGDFMDKSFCNDEELTALKEIKWNDLDCYFLCGNHESSVNDLRFSSISPVIGDFAGSGAHLLVNKSLTLNYETSQIHFIPYVTDLKDKSIKDFIYDINHEKKQIIISHNDIKGIQYGNFMSKNGFDIQEIEDNCDLYLNGHLHNSEFITNKILNVGSISAHNFTNDSLKYKYGAWVIDTDTLDIEFKENPFSLNFYKLNILDETDLSTLQIGAKNAVLTIKCADYMSEKVTAYLETNKTKLNIIEYRLILIPTAKENFINIAEKELQIDHLLELTKFCKENITNSDVLMAELAELCK